MRRLTEIIELKHTPYIVGLANDGKLFALEIDKLTHAQATWIPLPAIPQDGYVNPMVSDMQDASEIMIQNMARMIPGMGNPGGSEMMGLPQKCPHDDCSYIPKNSQDLVLHTIQKHHPASS